MNTEDKITNDKITNIEKTEFMWQPTKNGVRIVRVFGNALSVRVPDRIEGRQVTEIGAYCFSSSEHLPSADIFYTALENVQEEDGNQELENMPPVRQFVLENMPPVRQFGLENMSAERRIEKATLPAICGKYVEEIWLPESVTTLHNAAFYNCRKLKKLSVGRQIYAIGSDEFMNCQDLKLLVIRGSHEEASGLSLILERLISELEVRFCPGKGETKDKEKVYFAVGKDGMKEEAECALFFPEYYEWLSEISPAHIFSRSIEGEGFRMRKVFRDNCIDFRKYDQCFPSVLTGEGDSVICRIARNRLRYPVSLTQEDRDIYETALRERFEVAVKMIVKDRDLSWLDFFCNTFTPTADLLSQWMMQCIEEDWGEGTAFIMEEIHKKEKHSFAEKTFDFDDF